MSVACFIPIKANSERVKGKNFRLLNGKKLYEYICEHVKEADIFDDVFIDTNSSEIANYAEKMDFKVIEREPRLALDTANGNDLLVHHLELYPDYDYYFQLFATAPYLSPETIRTCVMKLNCTGGGVQQDTNEIKIDSCFTAQKHYGFYWLNGMPFNYRPDVLPRSQDLVPVIEETTGLYGISREALEKYRCRIGKNPYIHLVNYIEGVDINSEDDLKLAEYIGRAFNGSETDVNGTRL